MKKRDKSPPPMIELGLNGRLTPATPYDMETLQVFPVGTEFDLVSRTKRSSKHLRTYWMALHRVIKVTGRWPSAEHLHDELKLICGFRRNVINMETGEVATVVDSIAFEAMNHEEFKNYMNIAMEKLSEAVGFDPLHFLGQAA